VLLHNNEDVEDRNKAKGEKMWPPATIGLMVTVTTIGMNGSVAFQTDNAVCLRDGGSVSFITRVFSC